MAAVHVPFLIWHTWQRRIARDYSTIGLNRVAFCTPHAFCYFRFFSVKTPFTFKDCAFDFVIEHVLVLYEKPACRNILIHISIALKRWRWLRATCHDHQPTQHLLQLLAERLPCLTSIRSFGVPPETFIGNIQFDFICTCQHPDLATIVNSRTDNSKVHRHLHKCINCCR
jgi:hypothetical protein